MTGSPQPDAAYRPSLVPACRQAGLTADGARLLRVHANAIYHLPAENAVVRIRNAAALDRMRIAVKTAAWLADQGYPAVRPLKMTQPIVVGPNIATFWEYLPPGDGRRPETKDLAQLLRDLHQHPLPPFPLSPIRPLGYTADEARISTVLSEHERNWLIDRCSELEEAFARLTANLPSVIVHGDGHTNNVIPHPTLGWALIDWDSVGTGPPHYDFMPTYLRPRRFGYPETTWRSFAIAYGIDPADENHLQLLAQIREIRSLSAFVRGAQHNPAAHAELNNRLSSLMTEDRTRIWHAL
ncbi:aminoglycoside phosphotransferase family protein [Thermopolyspora sp. NPDC052614]|uniref:aminoglycoside phosphotransferase family protein n=1 Tax=Thermopolyspora sp. NPDC052614 TaxID=3155682 RepID=UPI003422E2BC